jgi:hypothetical protein
MTEIVRYILKSGEKAVKIAREWQNRESWQVFELCPQFIQMFGMAKVSVACFKD